jgi:hypothetical protein
MKFIPLHPLERNKFAIVDDDDYDFLVKFKWFHVGNPDPRFPQYAQVNLKLQIGRSICVGMHRVIMGDKEKYKGWAKRHKLLRVSLPNGKQLFIGTNKTGGLNRITVDHFDRNGLNNQKSNLKFATSTEQRKNKRKAIITLHDMGAVLDNDLEKASCEIAAKFKESLDRSSEAYHNFFSSPLNAGENAND